MNIQERITEKIQEHMTLRALLKKELSLWSAAETSRYENIAIASIQKDLVEISIQLLNAELYIEKPLKDWTEEEKEKYGSKEQLRKEKMQLRKEKELLLQLKVIEMTIAGGVHGINEDLPIVEMNIDITPEEATKKLIRLTTDGDTPLESDDSIPAQTTAKTLLFTDVSNGSAQQPLVPTLWRATGSINGARKVGFRRGMYRTAQTYLGFYEKRNGIKQDPFSYRDDGLLTINVLFEKKDNALHFRADVYEHVGIVSPQSDLTVSISVDLASDAVLDEMILFGHYVHDDDSPSDTSEQLSVVTELYDTSPLLQYQRIERAALFSGRLKADKVHLIDKSLCEKGKQFAKFQDSENNFLALSKDAHRWFNGGLMNCKEKVPDFKLLIKHISSESDPTNDHRYRVELTVEAYDNESARLLFPRLKDGSSIVGDLQAETFVYVKNPEEFRVCLSWKNDKIDAIWNFEYYSRT